MLERLSRVKSNFSVEELADSYRINRFFGNHLRTIEISKEALANGERMTQEQWLDFEENGFQIATLPMYHTLFGMLYDRRFEQEVNPVRCFLEALLEDSIATASQITYTPKGKDRLSHGNSSSKEFMHGVHSFLREEENAPQVCRALFDIDDAYAVDQVYQWLTGKDTYIWCSVKPISEPTTRGISLGRCNSDRLMIICNDRPDQKRPALGLRIK